ncbi:CYFA0S04e05798g1_1 [Cyberlindnera fabianii]|uniref:CYFA0S04e05798g1_1 n=1 Tax=Cyberlindnera fabianii TaxID=36022 RepID=A0A061AXS0_CYBFA|nr:CYFA0S04e05798g1_1 [Cyberlindnera fabianii]
MVSFTEQELWGGAITTNIPDGLVDASQFRQVPDTQEVFLVPTENTTDYEQMHKNDTIIFDLLERVDGADVDAVKEHFADIAHLNDADEWKLISIDEAKTTITPPTKSYIGVGIEPSKKWGRDESKGKGFQPALVVVLGVVRLAKVDTDLLVTYNVPLGEAEELEGLYKIHESEQKLSSATDSDNIALKRIELAVNVVKQIIENLNVADWGLFG